MKMKKRLLSILLSLVMVLGLMPGMSTTAYADVTQEDSNEYVGYRRNDNGFDVYGKREKADGTIEEIQTTWNNSGYTTVMEVVGESGGSITFNSFAYGKEYTSNHVKASVTARVRGRGVLVTYTLFNDSDELKQVKIGSYADTQIYADDSAPCSFTENGIKMTSKDGTLEFQLIPGGGKFTTRWYGKYSLAQNNVFNDQTDTSTYTEDSGIAWSWTIDIPARATITKTALLSAGQAGTTQIIYDANGGTGEMDPTVDIPGVSIKLNKNTFTKDDYVFQGWDTNSAGTTVVYADEDTLTMPDTNRTLYAVWKENKEITAAAEGFEGTYDGKEHGITVTVTDPSSGATIKYGKTAGTYDLDASPTITNVVDSPLTVYFKVTANGYKGYTGSATVTINKANAVPATVTANNRTYDGAEKSLVTVDDSTLDGGMMQYALGSDATTEPTEGWRTSIPSKTDAGTYYVWYKAVADDSGNYTDSEAKCVAAAISQGAAAPTAPTGDKLTYNGADQALLKAGSTSGGTMLYALGTDATTAPSSGWSTDVPTGKDAGTYYAWYKIDGGANYNSVAPVCISVEVAKATGTPTDAQKPAARTGLVANGQAQALLTAPTSLPEGYTKIQYSTDGGSTWSDAIPTGTVAGAYAVSVKYVGDANHNDIDGGSISVTVAAPEPEPQPEPAPAPASVANPSGIPILTITSAGSDALNFALTNVSGVDGFDLYLTECGNRGAFPLFASIDGLNATLSGFKVGEAYKGYAQPWVMVNGVKTSVLGATLVSHCFTDNGNKKMTNPGSLTLKKQALTIRLGKTASLKGTVKGVRKGKLINHDAKLRYISSNPAVATVSAKGKVKGVGAGSCDIYVLTLNGIWQRVPVTVDAGPSKVKLKKVKKDMAIGETQALGAKLVLTPTGAVTTFTWSSSNPSVASVDANGVVTALAKGKATITVATANGKKAKVKIKVE